MKNFFFYQNQSAGINKIVNLTDEQLFWRKHTYLRFALMKAYRQQNNREANWDAWERQYEAYRPPKNLNWQSNIVPPFTTSVVESALSEMIDQNLMPLVAARCKGDVPKATVLNYINKYLWQIGYADLELYKSMKQQLIFGTTFWQESYLQEHQKVKILAKYNPKTGQEEYEEIDMMGFDDCYGETVNIREIWFDPNARGINIGPYKAADAIRRFILHIDDFKNTFVGSRWDKFKLAEAVKPGGDLNYYEFYKPPQGIDRDSQVEVLFHWIRNPDILVIMANDIPFFIGPKPYNHKKLPFARGNDLMNLWDIYGKGEPQLLESIQDELTTNRRMRLDRQKLDIYKMIFVSNRETVTDNDLIPAPMKPIYVDDPNNVKAFEYGDVNPSAYKEEMLLKEDGVRVTGIDDSSQSVKQAASTATQAAMLKEATLKRLRTKIWLTSKLLLTEMIELRVPNVVQFYQVPKIQEIIGRDAMDKWNQRKQAALDGRLITQGGKYFEQQYRTIATHDKMLVKMGEGQVKVIDKRGDHFFMVTPDVLVPSESGFTYKLGAEPTVPLSKPLLQQKVGEFLVNPVIQAAFTTGYYDINKAADKFTEINDFDVDDFISEKYKEQQPEGESLVDPEKMMAMASKENETMMQGVDLPGTPYSTPEHTLTHTNFMQSDAFKQGANPNIIKTFYKHVQWENAAQQARSQGMGEMNKGQDMGQASPGGMASIRTKETQGINQGALKNTMPSKQVGPENVPDLTGLKGFGPGR